MRLALLLSAALLVGCDGSRARRDWQRFTQDSRITHATASPWVIDTTGGRFVATRTETLITRVERRFQ